MGKVTEDKNEKTEKTSKKDLPEILELELDGKDVDPNEIVLLLEKSLALKIARDQVTADYDAAKEDLGALQKLSGLEGLRHNNIAFMVSYREGRESVDMKVLREELVAHNVDPRIVSQCIENSTKVGKGFYVHEVVDLSKQKEKRDERWGRER